MNTLKNNLTAQAIALLTVAFALAYYGYTLYPH